MLTFQGKTKASVMIDEIDDTTRAQIIKFTNHPAFNEDMIIMADCHAGKGSVIGYTRKLEHNIIPNIVGVDLGCGVRVVKFAKFNISSINFPHFDSNVKRIPMGNKSNNRNTLIEMDKDEDLYKEICKRICKGNQWLDYYQKIAKGIGSIGSGNHFLELDVDSEGYLYAVVHSGSRNFGKCVADFYQKMAVDFCKQMHIDIDPEETYLDLAYGGQEYIEAMKVCQKYATLNRKHIMQNIIYYFHKYHNIDIIDEFECIHNYINFEDNIIRKGAISAHAGEKVIIPLTMKDGIILGTGKENPLFNYSAPHGAGRLMSRNEARQTLNVEEFKESMKDIYSSTVNEKTLDEAPNAYKPAQMIIDAIKDTVDIKQIIKPIYNIKSEEENSWRKKKKV